MVVEKKIVFFRIYFGENISGLVFISEATLDKLSF